MQNGISSRFQAKTQAKKFPIGLTPCELAVQQLKKNLKDSCYLRIHHVRLVVGAHVVTLESVGGGFGAVVHALCAEIFAVRLCEISTESWSHLRAKFRECPTIIPKLPTQAMPNVCVYDMSVLFLYAMWGG